MRIAAVDDEAHVRERFERMVTNKKDMELCGLFETGEQLLNLFTNTFTNNIGEYLQY